MKKIQTLTGIFIMALVLLRCISKPGGESIIQCIYGVIEKTTQGILADLPQE